MRGWKTLAVLLFALMLGVSRTASATPISVGVVAFDTFIAGPGGTNAFFVSNLTGDPLAGGFALPPDFPVATSLVFDSPLLEWVGPTGSPFNFGHVGIGPGSHDPDSQIQFPDTAAFVSARFTAVLSQVLFRLTDGRLFAASSPTIQAILIDPAGALVPGDLALLTVDAREVTGPPDAVPEPASLTLVATALAGLWRVRRLRPAHRRSLR
jgi:PEP-CTERM motif